MKINRILQIALLIELFLGTLAGAQVTVAANTSLDPHLFLTLQDFETRKAIVQREPWAKAALTAIVREADGYPKDYLNRFGLTKVAHRKRRLSGRTGTSAPRPVPTLSFIRQTTTSAQIQGRITRTGRSAMCTIT
jgi:hypothetical protein